MSSRVDATALLRRLCAAIDAHAWDEMAALLHPDFRCRLVHTGEEFDKAGWVRLNADYPGFERLTLEDLVGAGDRAVARAHVTGRTDAGVQHFAVASFATAREGLIAELVEVWTDLDQAPPEHTR